MHLAYAHLPARLRKSSFSFLSRRKKAIFAGKQTVAVATEAGEAGQAAGEIGKAG